jgi:hypothetical protein
LEIEKLEKNIREETKGECFNVQNVVNKIKENLKKSGK